MNCVLVGPAGVHRSLHRRLMVALERGARAQDHSQLLVALYEDIDAQVRTTVAAGRARREQLRAARERSQRSQSDS